MRIFLSILYFLGATGFSIGNKGYLGSGYIYTSGPSGDFWEYDPALNTWLAKRRKEEFFKWLNI